MGISILRSPLAYISKFFPLSLRSLNTSTGVQAETIRTNTEINHNVAFFVITSCASPWCRRIKLRPNLVPIGGAMPITPIENQPGKPAQEI